MAVKLLGCKGVLGLETIAVEVVLLDDGGVLGLRVVAVSLIGVLSRGREVLGVEIATDCLGLLLDKVEAV